MRIAILCADASTNSLVRVYPIAKVLQRRHDVRLLGFRSADQVFAPYSAEFEFDTTRARRLPRFLGQVAALASRVDADLVYAFKPLPASFWVGLLARRRLRVPLLLDVEDDEVAFYEEVPLLDRLRHLVHLERPNGYLWSALTARAAKLADEVFVVSRTLQRRFGGTLLVHGADTAAFDPSRVSRAQALRALDLPDADYVVFTGAPARHKGIEDLLEAVRRLSSPRLRVLIVGSFRQQPALREELEARHGGYLVVRDARPHAEMPAVLAAARAVVLPQRAGRIAEAQVPGKVFEAMAMARPIVATAVSDLPEILDGCGHVVAPGDVDALASGMEAVLSRPDEAKAMGTRARIRCEQLYSWDAMERVLTGTLARWERRGD